MAEGPYIRTHALKTSKSRRRGEERGETQVASKVRGRPKKKGGEAGGGKGAHTVEEKRLQRQESLGYGMFA